MKGAETSQLRSSQVQLPHVHVLKLKRNIITADNSFDNIFYNFYVCHERITHAIAQTIYFVLTVNFLCLSTHAINTTQNIEH